MIKYVAFLRGINIGGRTIKMVDLKSCFEDAGLKNVNTVLQSGNVIFESDNTTTQLKKKIEETLTKTFEYPAKAQVVLFDDLQGIIKSYPFGPARADYHQYVIFIEDDLEAQLVAEAGKLLGEQVQAGLGIVYWSVKKGMTLKSQFAKLLNKTKYKQFNTVRNINTLQKIIAL